jgi:hypothetical protein
MADLVRIVNESIGIIEGQFYVAKAITEVVNDTMGITETVIHVVTGTPNPGLFSLVATPITRTIEQRNSTTYTITTETAGGYIHNILLSYSGQPTGCTVSFDVNPIAYNGTAVMTINTTNMVGPVGTYTVLVTGDEVIP